MKTQRYIWHVCFRATIEHEFFKAASPDGISSCSPEVYLECSGNFHDLEAECLRYFSLSYANLVEESGLPAKFEFKELFHAKICNGFFPR